MVKYGEMYRLGEHRLLCGDSTDPGNVTRLMGGETAVLAHCDPPYGMGRYASKGVKNDNLNRHALIDFNRGWFTTVLSALDGLSGMYIWGTDQSLLDLYAHVLLSYVDNGVLTLRNVVTWYKGAARGMRYQGLSKYAVASEKCLYLAIGYVPGRRNAADFDALLEPIRAYLYDEAQKCGVNSHDKWYSIFGNTMYRHYFTRSQWSLMPERIYNMLQGYGCAAGAFTRPYADLLTEYKAHRTSVTSEHPYFDNCHDNMTDVWLYESNNAKQKTLTTERASAGGFPTLKPQKICERIVKTSAPVEGIVLDPFGGGGSTLISCETLGKRCRMIEIEPHWCDVIINRWETQTGRKAERM